MNANAITTATLPKALRRDLVPAPDVAREVVGRLGAPSGDLRDAVARELRSLRGVTVPRDAWDLSKLPPHLRITVRVPSRVTSMSASMRRRAVSFSSATSSSPVSAPGSVTPLRQ